MSNSRGIQEHSTLSFPVESVLNILFIRMEFKIFFTQLLQRQTISASECYEENNFSENKVNRKKTYINK